MKKNLLLLSFLAASFVCRGEVLDFDKIVHWTGDGPNRAAFVLSFYTDGGKSNPGSIVWGYRWDDSVSPSAYDMIREIAKGSSDLVVLTQFTGDLGNTFDGAGYSDKLSTLISNIKYDYAKAKADNRISFGFDVPNKSMNQTSAPGDAAPGLVANSITAAIETHVIDHPLNAEVYGYPAYDYDWWQLDESLAATPDNFYWNAGWYVGYWSYWVGDTDMENLNYSGLGMSSMEVLDGDVHAFRYSPFENETIDDEWAPLNYRHFLNENAYIEPVVVQGEESARYYSLDGRMLPSRPAEPGVYIVVKNGVNSKIAIK